MTIERTEELGLDEVKRLISDKVFVIDTSVLRDKNGALINGGFTFINTLLNYTLGKVHFVSSGEETHMDLNRWIDSWHISNHQFFMRFHVWNPSESILKLIKNLNASDSGELIVLTDSSKLEKSIVKQCPEVFKVMKVNKSKPDFSFHKVWYMFHNPEFWQVNNKKYGR